MAGSAIDVVMVGVNFRTAPLELREGLSFAGAPVQEALQTLRAELADTELLLLSTCNRTELYAAAPGDLDAARVRAAFLRLGKTLSPALGGHLYSKRREEAVAHLLTVATSLDSLVVGETEILSQVKQAYQLALAAGTTGKLLNAVVQQVFRVAKRVHSETQLSRGRVSVGSIAVDLAAKVFEDLGRKAVMVIGAGKVGEQALRSLVARGVKETYVSNRSPERGQEMAGEYGGTAVPFERLADFLPRADIVICSTSAPHCVLRVDTVRAAMAARHNRPVLFIDLAVPRNIEAEVGRIDNAYLYNLDDLEGIAGDNLSKRRGAMEQARAIIREEAAAIAAGVQAEALGIGELMRQLDDRAAAIQEAELARAFAKDRVAPLGVPCEACREEISAMLHRALAKMLAGPKKALHEAAAAGRWDEVARLAAELYGLEDSAADQEPKQDDEH